MTQDRVENGTNRMLLLFRRETATAAALGEHARIRRRGGAAAVSHASIAIAIAVVVVAARRNNGLSVGGYDGKDTGFSGALDDPTKGNAETGGTFLHMSKGLVVRRGGCSAIFVVVVTWHHIVL